MRRRHSRLVARLALAGVAAATSPISLRAQDGAAQEGALFLLLPIGARAAGMGQAVVASRAGSEAVWWNPSALAWSDRPEAAIHHSESIVGTGDAISIVVPSSLLGVLTVSVNILNTGELPVTDEDGTEVGRILSRNFVYAGTYATRIGDRIAAGITYKVLQLRTDCSGLCRAGLAFSATTTALDAGAQLDLGPRLPISLGAAIRNVGPRLQVTDNAQSDPLPRRLQVGVLYRIAALKRYAKDTELHLAGDLVDDLRLDDPSAQVGADVVWQQRVHLRAGYVFSRDEGDEGSGPSLGFGLAAGSLIVDLARQFEGLSADAGEAPTYVSLRYLF